ncbi:MAG: RNase adaptor protein RapZ [Alphaproteobacteria bacterium]|nr:RNase adaptor protein RapZ [Alphaproteobacteria bacterium]
MTSSSELQLVLICGLAGSGYSTALHVLEDNGFSAVDNVPLALVDKLISLEVETAGRRLAVSLDGRTSGFDAAGLAQLMADIRRRLGDAARLVFLSASDDATRRHHPLDDKGDLMAAIADDWMRMAPVQGSADVAIDTSSTSPTDFRAALLGQLQLMPPGPLPVYIQSFSNRGGIPRDADMVLDMRFLDNPHWHPGLEQQTGLDDGVQAFLTDSPSFAPAMEALKNMISIALPRFSAEGRPQFSIAVGCTGGRHRSVFAAVKMAEMVKTMGHAAVISHRDLKS